MKAQERPVVLVVFAILNFLAGAYGLCSACSGSLSLIFMSAGVKYLANTVRVPPGQPNPLEDLGGIFDAIPGFHAFTITTSIMGSIVGILLIVAGVGLLQVRNWARWLCVIYSLYMIPATIGGTVYQIVVVQPAMEKWQADFAAKLEAMQKNAVPPGGAAPPPGGNPFGMGMGSGVSTISAIFMATIMLAYPIVLLVFLFLPSISEAFQRARLEAAKPPGRGRASRSGDRDEEDEGEERPPRRRSDGDEDRFRRRTND